MKYQTEVFAFKKTLILNTWCYTEYLPECGPSQLEWRLWNGYKLCPICHLKWAPRTFSSTEFIKGRFLRQTFELLFSLGTLLSAGLVQQHRLSCLFLHCICPSWNLLLLWSFQSESGTETCQWAPTAQADEKYSHFDPTWWRCHLVTYISLIKWGHYYQRYLRFFNRLTFILCGLCVGCVCVCTHMWTLVSSTSCFETRSFKCKRLAG